MLPTKQQLEEIKKNIQYVPKENKITVKWDKYEFYLDTSNSKMKEEDIIKSQAERVATSFWNLTQQTPEFQSKYLIKE